MLAVDPPHADLNGSATDSGRSTPRFNGPFLSRPTLTARQNVFRRFEKRATIVLVGVRGAGKRSLGFIAATHLRRRFVSEGLYWENVVGTSKAAYLQRHGKAAFHQRALDVFRQMLEKNDRDCVIECGMGSLTKQAQELLRQYGRAHAIVHIIRNFEHIAQHLKLDVRQMEHLREADLTHRSCSNFEFYNLYDCTCLAEIEIMAKDFTPSSTSILQDVKLDFQNFVDTIVGKTKDGLSGPFSLSDIPLERKYRSYATSIQLSELLSETVDAGTLESGEDAIELLVDFWSSDIMSVISKQVSSLRRRTGLPLLYSMAEKGIDPTKSKAIAYSEMLEHGFRLALDYVFIDASLPEDYQRRLLQSKGGTRAIADHVFRDPALRAWSDPRRILICEKAQKLGYDLVRLRQEALERKDNADVQHFARVASERVQIPIIAYNEGCYGKSSKISNRIMTPVEHRTSSMESAVSELGGGKICVRASTTALFRSFEYDQLHFYILGQSVFFSRSPAMYKAAFKLYGMGHDFSYREISSFDELLAMTRDPFFGGSAISFPFKADAFRACSASSPHASVIGSVNTILPLRQLLGESTTSLPAQANQRNMAGPVVGLYGDNTDWEGLYRTVQRKMSPRNAATRTRSNALVLGAGGSARSSVYALLQLGCQTVYLYNRTYDNAVRISDHFNAWVASSNDRSTQQTVLALKPGELDWPQDAALPTIIVACVPTTTASLYGQPQETFELPEQWLGSPSGGVAVDISYNPPDTPFLEQVRKLRNDKGKPWSVVTGIEIVYEQAILQFEQMTGYRAPRMTMRKALKE